MQAQKLQVRAKATMVILMSVCHLNLSVVFLNYNTALDKPINKPQGITMANEVHESI